MIRTLLLRYIILIALLFLTGCNTDIQKMKQPDILSMEQMLLQNKKFNKDDNFQLRKFTPEVNNGVIGNGVSYGFYRKGQAPWGKGPSEEEILEDLRIIEKYWKIIRVYNADNDTELVLNTIRKNNIKLKVMLGVWLTKESGNPEGKNSNIKNVIRCVELSNKYKDIVSAVNVGNETQVIWSGHRMDQKNLINYIRAIRNSIEAPITTADDHMFWSDSVSVKVSDEIDFITYHAHPVWNGKKIAESKSWMNEVLNKIKNLHSGKKIVLGETGWATSYDPTKIGDGQQSTLIKGKIDLEGQEEYLKILDQWTKENNITLFLFEAFDEPWKGGGEVADSTDIEKHWGVYFETRKPKISFTNYNKELKYVQ
ncbi:MAG: hypothetical protein PF638_03380 [Candidatus Delongbacteria bacterium]|jgi:exo-beta-1,3-glucanase (GH17 family)|nr:hypothetical protein [Candidatus Delongbacteria bacterium]